MNIFMYVIYFAIFASTLYSLYNSFAARRSQDPIRRGLLSARMNIGMGTMLTLFAFIQLFLFQSANEGSTIRVIIGALFLLLGLFNIFAGLRNRKIFLAKANKQSR
jgi:multisubunit Na+/H+ antiporter MnhG subunit